MLLVQKYPFANALFFHFISLLKINIAGACWQLSSNVKHLTCGVTVYNCRLSRCMPERLPGSHIFIACLACLLAHAKCSSDKTWFSKILMHSYSWTFSKNITNQEPNHVEVILLPESWSLESLDQIISTTPIMGYWQCLPLSVVQLKGKHCRKPYCRNGVVNTFLAVSLQN